MAPVLVPTHQKLPSPFSAILTNIHKRSTPSCADNDASCYATHRLVILVIILFVGFLVSLIFTHLYFRSRKRKIIHERQARAAREQMNLRKIDRPSQGLEWQPPPPYMPRRPESAARVCR
ncbi:hypothetical protein J1614_007713 [Plenodomus biglobosus]|nr:hypothetical protein J1614_007713 [Plenodomus biglobosus]